MSILIGQLIGMCLAAAIGLTAYIQKQCYVEIYMQRAHNKIWNYIKCGLPFIPSMLCSRILASGDRWVLAHYTNLHDVGLYSLADTCGQLFQMAVLVPLASSYIPHLLQTYTKNKNNIKTIEHKNIQTMWYCMAAMAAIITLGYILGKPIALLILPITYHPALQYTWLLLMGYIFLMGTHFTNCLMQFYKKTWFISGVYIVPATLNITLNIILVPHVGIYGCVLATVCSYMLYFIVCLGYNRIITQHIKK
jgi:O-antigen/teichoic acid export membrane protein